MSRFVEIEIQGIALSEASLWGRMSAVSEAIEVNRTGGERDFWVMCLPVGNSWRVYSQCATWGGPCPQRCDGFQMRWMSKRLGRASVIRTAVRETEEFVQPNE